jgi:hypothetical protein
MMKKYVLLIIQIFVMGAISAQSPLARTFDYDASGNRLLRKTVTMRSAVAEPDTMEITDSRKNADCFIDQIGRWDVHVFPNPTSGLLTLSFDKPVKKGLYQVFSLSGKILMKGNLAQKTQLDMSAMPSGTYLLEIKIDNLDETWKIIKQ